MYDLDRVQGAPPVKPSTFLAAVTTGSAWMLVLARLLDSVS